MSNPGDRDLIQRVGAHIEQHVGSITTVFHEIISDDLHVDVYHVAPSLTRRFHTLVTSGMSERPMHTGSEAAEFRFAELVMLLEPQWQVRAEAFEDERHYWPIRLLKTLARYPFEAGTWLGYGHTVAGQDPPVPFAPSTQLCASILLPPMSLGKAFWRMRRADGTQTFFWAVVPLYEEELRLKLASGAEALQDALDRTKIDDVVHQERPRAGQRRRWFGLF